MQNAPYQNNDVNFDRVNRHVNSTNFILNINVVEDISMTSSTSVCVKIFVEWDLFYIETSHLICSAN